MEFIEFYQTPLRYKKFIHYTKLISAGFLLFSVVAVLFMLILGAFSDLFTAISVPCMLLILPAYIFLQRWYYDCKTESKIRLCKNTIQIIDWRGQIKQEICYRKITTMRIEEITGFFYGGDRDNGTNIYICLFMNGQTQIPDVEYKKLYYQDDFVLIAYDDRVYSVLKERLRMI